ncbi:MAG: NAD-dependent epimerase/dehydratase family protein, partial [Crocinitomicaceae bacterium]|nr:NAD-dependent epimerase/dehydratase family protein [Crocinitomicaceae bacterium]
MLKIGITGQAGFVGTHLYNTLRLHPEEFERVPFEKDFFSNRQQLDQFVSQCDVIVHLAAMNRHNDPQVIFDTNIELAQKLVDALESTKSRAHVIFSSSTQEERDNEYGKSKKVGRELLYNWSIKSGGKFTGLIIPNVFGPFGHPNYNSVIATFCHQLTHHETPSIAVDGELKLIYVGELVEGLISEIRGTKSQAEKVVPYTATAKVSDILTLLEKYKSEYQEKGIIPFIATTFELNL